MNEMWEFLETYAQKRQKLSVKFSDSNSKIQFVNENQKDEGGYMCSRGKYLYANK